MQSQQWDFGSLGCSVRFGGVGWGGWCWWGGWEHQLQVEHWGMPERRVQCASSQIYPAVGVRPPGTLIYWWWLRWLTQAEDEDDGKVNGSAAVLVCVVPTAVTPGMQHSPSRIETHEASGIQRCAHLFGFYCYHFLLFNLRFFQFIYFIGYCWAFLRECTWEEQGGGYGMAVVRDRTNGPQIW